MSTLYVNEGYGTYADAISGYDQKLVYGLSAASTILPTISISDSTGIS